MATPNAIVISQRRVRSSGAINNILNGFNVTYTSPDKWASKRRDVNFGIYTILIYVGPYDDEYDKLKNCFLFVATYRIEPNAPETTIQLLGSRIMNQYCRFVRNATAGAKRVVVIDLDETLIDCKDRAIVDIKRVIACLRSYFDILVLWTHGDGDHLRSSLVLHPDIQVDQLYYRDAAIDENYQKGLGHVLKSLNENLRVSEIAYSCLIDDCSDNYQQDYNTFIHMPSEAKANDELTSLLCKAIQMTNECAISNVTKILKLK